MNNLKEAHLNRRLLGIRLITGMGLVSILIMILFWLNTGSAFSKIISPIIEEPNTSDHTFTRTVITFPGNSGPLNTGINVQQNDFIRITATGEIFNGDWNFTPDGALGPPDPQWGNTILPNISSNSLVGSIGDFSTGILIDDGYDENPDGISGTDIGYPGLFGPGYIGSFFETIATVDGDLFLAFNDIPLDDNTGSFEVTIIVSQACTVPFFSQRDDEWINHPLRTQNNTCSEYCSTLGHCGCTLTSSAMIFKNYGANTNPPALSDCMGTSACPYDWNKGAQACSEDRTKWNYQNRVAWNDSSPSESWERLESEINENHRPVILGMHLEENPENTHWVVVHTGQGSDPEYYLIHDPWYKCGANIPLATRSDDWDFDWLIIYEGKNPCSSLDVVNPPCVAQGANPQPIQTSSFATGSLLESISPEYDLTPNSIISGTIVLFTRTSITMTAEITASSSVGTITEMLIWSDTLSNTNWQSYTSYVWLPVSNFVYVQFRDNLGNLSETYSDTINPIGPPTAPFEIFLPLTVKYP